MVSKLLSKHRFKNLVEKDLNPDSPGIITVVSIDKKEYFDEELSKLDAIQIFTPILGSPLDSRSRWWKNSEKIGLSKIFHFLFHIQEEVFHINEVLRVGSIIQETMRSNQKRLHLNQVSKTSLKIKLIRKQRLNIKLAHCEASSLQIFTKVSFCAVELKNLEVQIRDSIILL
jgi:hypothetical protein